MEYRYQKPHASIAEYVRTVLVVKGPFEIVSKGQPLFTNGQPSVLCKLGNGTNEITLFGQGVPEEYLVTHHNATLVTYFFKPFALGTTFRVAAKELKNNPVGLSRWNGPKSTALNGQLLAAGSADEEIEILDNFIAAQIQANQKECRIIKYATDRMMYDSGPDVLADILEVLGLTERTFQRIFKKYVGVTPGQYRRVCQFYFAFEQLRGGEFNSLTEVAYSNGYFDQSHYIRSFKEFAETTPQEYLHSGLKKKKG